MLRTEDSRRHRLLARAGPDRLSGRTAHAPEPPRSSARRRKRQASLWSGRRERCGAVGDLSEYAVNGASCLRCPDVAKVQSIQVKVLLSQKASTLPCQTLQYFVWLETGSVGSQATRARPAWATGTCSPRDLAHPLVIPFRINRVENNSII